MGKGMLLSALMCLPGLAWSETSYGGKPVQPVNGSLSISSGNVTVNSQGGALDVKSTSTVLSGSLPAGSNMIGKVDIVQGQGAAAVTSTSTVVTGSLPAGTNTIGKVGLDQSGGAANFVSTSVVVTGTIVASVSTVTVNTQGGAIQVTSTSTVITGSLPAGSNTIGKVDQGAAAAASGAWPTKVTDGTDTADVTAAGAVKVDGSAVTQPVSGTVTSNQGTAGSSAWPVKDEAVSDPTEYKQSATGTSSTIVSANASRITIECSVDCADTGKVHYKLGGAAATTNDPIWESCASWQPPSGVRFTGAVQVISENADSKTVRCTEY